MTGCIYCGSNQLTEEHYLPEGLGKFRGYETLDDRVCIVCQGKCSQLEEQFLRNGPEAFFRKLVAKVGKKHHEKIAVFYRRNMGVDPVRVVGKYPGEEYPILWEPNEGERTATAMRQIIVRDSDGDFHQIPIPAPIDVEGVKSSILGMFEEGAFELVAVFADEPDFDKMKAVVQAIDPKKQITWKPTSDERTKIQVTGAASVTDKYLRAIAKIGFHFFLKVCDRYTGHEAVFLPIKQFILEGGDWRPHVQWYKGSLAANVDRYSRPNTFLHILVAEKTHQWITAKMQFFIGPTVWPLIYAVRLAANPERIVSEESWAYSYLYFDKKDAERFDGVVEPKTQFSRTLLP